MRPDVDTTDCTIFRYKSTPLAIHYAQLGHRCLREDSATERAPRTIGREAIEGGEAGLLSLDLGTLNTVQTTKPTGFGALGQHRVSIAGAFCVSRCVSEIVYKLYFTILSSRIATPVKGVLRIAVDSTRARRAKQSESISIYCRRIPTQNKAIAAARAGI